MEQFLYHWVWTDLYVPVWPNIAASAILAVAVLRRFNCRQKWCWRLGLHKVSGTTYRTCRHHTTGRHHATLFARHAARFPEQHAHLNKQATDEIRRYDG